MFIRIQSLQPVKVKKSKYEATLIVRKLPNGQFQLEKAQVRNTEKELNWRKSLASVAWKGKDWKVVSGSQIRFLEQGQHCICRRGSDQNSQMLQCDKCKEWFHPQCVGLSEDFLKQIEHYYCVLCWKRFGKVCQDAHKKPCPQAMEWTLKQRPLEREVLQFSLTAQQLPYQIKWKAQLQEQLQMLQKWKQEFNRVNKAQIYSGSHQKLL